MTFTKKTWLVTGASNGLGTDISIAALKRGHKVIGTARNVEKASQAHPSFEKLGGVWIALDVTSSSCQDIVADAVKKYDVSVLVNNAGYAEGGTLEDSRYVSYRVYFTV